MKRAVLALILMGAATAAHAQPFIPGPPPGYGGPGYGPDYWRERREGEEWRRRAEFREAEHRRWEWRRAHCVRDYRGQEFCRP